MISWTKSIRRLKLQTKRDENLLALSWKIATEPKLYWQLIPNPYTTSALQTISERFPNFNRGDIIRAIVLAEPERRCDRDFKSLETMVQGEKLRRQRDVSIKMIVRLEKYCKKHAKELCLSSKEITYDTLSIIVFETTDIRKIEQIYSQNQRKSARLSIVNFIEDTQKKEKLALRRQLLKIAILTLPLILVFSLVQRQIENTAKQEARKQILGTETQKEIRVFPIRLVIPRIRVNSVIQFVGLTPGGSMEAPSNSVDAGWFELGPSPGERGSAVISGHFDGRIGEAGVFNNLDELKQGDKIYVTNGLGKTVAFVVRKSLIYNPGYADEVFSPKDNGIHLNLITCNGAWNKEKKSYDKRLVVFADIIN